MSPDKFSLESLQKEEEQMLKARMQLEMLKDETRQQKAILDTVDSRNLQVRTFLSTYMFNPDSNDHAFY